MLYMIHHPKNGNPPDLCGEGAKDMISCRFDVSLEDMKALMATIPERRKKEYGLDTGKLYLSERGRKVVYELNN